MSGAEQGLILLIVFIVLVVVVGYVFYKDT